MPSGFPDGILLLFELQQPYRPNVGMWTSVGFMGRNLSRSRFLSLFFRSFFALGILKQYG